jgi:hypothetical protein
MLSARARAPARGQEFGDWMQIFRANRLQVFLRYEPVLAPNGKNVAFAVSVSSRKQIIILCGYKVTLGSKSFCRKASIPRRPIRIYALSFNTFVFVRRASAAGSRSAA